MLSKKRVMVFGATGYIGRQVIKELVKRQYQVVAVSRRKVNAEEFAGAELRITDATSRESLKDVFRDEINVVISCLANHDPGKPEDFYKIDYQATLNILQAAQENVTDHFILLSAICVRRPKLALQRAKLEMEHALMISGMDYTIVRPTAYFRDLAGQFANILKGSPAYMLGSGEYAHYKPIAKEDLAAYLANCIEDVGHRNRINIIGGPEVPENIVTYKRILEMSYQAIGREPKIKSLPRWVLSAVMGMTAFIGLFIPKVRFAAGIIRLMNYYLTTDLRAPGYGTITMKDHLEMMAAESEAPRAQRGASR